MVLHHGPVVIQIPHVLDEGDAPNFVLLPVRDQKELGEAKKGLGSRGNVAGVQPLRHFLIKLAVALLHVVIQLSEENHQVDS